MTVYYFSLSYGTKIVNLAVDQVLDPSLVPFDAYPTAVAIWSLKPVDPNEFIAATHLILPEEIGGKELKFE